MNILLSGNENSNTDRFIASNTTKNVVSKSILLVGNNCMANFGLGLGFAHAVVRRACMVEIY